MELGAFVVVPGREDFTAIHEVQPHDVASFENPRPLYSSRMPIVGDGPHPQARSAEPVAYFGSS